MCNDLKFIVGDDLCRPKIFADILIYSYVLADYCTEQFDVARLMEDTGCLLVIVLDLFYPNCCKIDVQEVKVLCSVPRRSKKGGKMIKPFTVFSAVGETYKQRKGKENLIRMFEKSCNLQP